MKHSFLKKFISLTLALVFCFTLTMTAFAAETTSGSTPPEKPSGSSDSSSTPPEKPDGDTSNSNGSAPEKPDGDTSNTNNENGTPPEMPDGESASEGGNAGGAPGGGSSSGVDSYTAVNEYTEDTSISGDTFTSTGTDENAILVSSGSSVFDGITVNRTSDDSTGGDNSSFYGVGAAILTKGGTSYITNATISTDAAGGAGVFAYSDGVVYIADSTITTEQNTSGGIHAAGGGTLYAWDLDVTTQGESSAAIRSDRGGGTMVINGGTYTSNGTGSPAVYCTADIAVNNSDLVANGSEGICIEGLNSLYIFDSNLTSNMPENDQNDCTWSVIVYQSMSGDSEVGCGTYQMIGGSLTSKNGGIFYTTNTESNFVIEDVDITSADDCEFFLRCTGNSNARGWGSTGSNGADCNFTAINQVMNGDIIWDSISTLDLYITEGSVLTGAVVDDESSAGNGGDGYADIYIDKDSSWVVTGNSTLRNLYNAGTIKDASGNTVTIKGTDGTVYVKGTSEYTITVENYETTVDLSGALTAASWSDYEQARPTQLGVSSSTGTTDNSGRNLVLIIVAIVVVLAAIIAVVMLVLKKKKAELLKEEEKSLETTEVSDTSEKVEETPENKDETKEETSPEKEE